MEKKYVAPEAVVIEFEEKDLLTLSKGESGGADEKEW